MGESFDGQDTRTLNPTDVGSTPTSPTKFMKTVFVDSDPKRIELLRAAGFEVLDYSKPSAMAGCHYDQVILINDDKFDPRLRSDCYALVRHGGFIFSVQV
jgi:hypothetical protein